MVGEHYSSQGNRPRVMGKTVMTASEYAGRNDDKLKLSNGDDLVITSNAHEVNIGCVTVTWAAWEVLKRKVEGLK